MSYLTLSPGALAPKNTVEGPGDVAHTLKMRDSFVLAFFSVAYESAVTILRIRSRLSPR